MARPSQYPLELRRRAVRMVAEVRPIIIDAETGERIEVLPDREAATLEAWLRGKKGIEVVCRDSSATYAEAIRRALPDAVQVSDRWHLWRNLCDKVLAEVRAHAPCWAAVNPPQPGGVRKQTTRERWHKVHALLDSGVGLGVLITSVVNRAGVLIMAKTSGVVEVSKLHHTRRPSCPTVMPA